MDHLTISTKGGISTKEKYGLTHYSDIGKLGAQKNLETKGKEYFLELSRKGVKARLAKIKNKALQRDNSST